MSNTNLSSAEVIANTIPGEVAAPAKRIGNPNWYKGMPSPAPAPDVRGRGTGKGTTLGRRRRLLHYIEKLAKKYDLETADPLEIIIFIGATGKDPLEANYKAIVTDTEWEKFFPKNQDDVLYRDKDGWVRVRGFIKPETRLECLKAALPYIHVRQAARETPEEVDKVSFSERSRIMQAVASDPETRTMLERVSERTAVMMHEADAEAEESDE